MARVLVGLSFPFVVHRPPELRETQRRRPEEVTALAAPPQRLARRPDRS